MGAPIANDRFDALFGENRGGYHREEPKIPPEPAPEAPSAPSAGQARGLCVAALIQAAAAFGHPPSALEYDRYRAENATSLPSSSVVRKWLGGWSDALRQAGLRR